MGKLELSERHLKAREIIEKDCVALNSEDQKNMR
jgi:hypothetical protein